VAERRDCAPAHTGECVLREFPPCKKCKVGKLIHRHTIPDLDHGFGLVYVTACEKCLSIVMFKEHDGQLREW